LVLLKRDPTSYPNTSPLAVSSHTTPYTACRPSHTCDSADSTMTHACTMQTAVLFSTDTHVLLFGAAVFSTALWILA
jgi:hypothetical protein